MGGSGTELGKAWAEVERELIRSADTREPGSGVFRGGWADHHLSFCIAIQIRETCLPVAAHT